MLEGPLPARRPYSCRCRSRATACRRSSKGGLDGLHEDGLADDTLQLTRKATGDRAQPLQSTSLPAFVSVERELTLGLRWTVKTVVRRVTPTGTAVVLEVPLLAGESVTTQDVRVQNGRRVRL